MKKYLFGGLAVLIIAALVAAFWNSVSSMTNDDTPVNTNNNVVTTPIVSDFSVGVEKLVEMDKETIYLIADSIENTDGMSALVYYYETQVELSGAVDTTQNPKPVNVVNVFQITVLNPINSIDAVPTVYRFVHSESGESYLDKHVGAWWLGDNNMLDIDMPITLTTALDNLQKVNFKKPNSRFVTLRFEICPNPTHPKWMFGNDKKGMLTVDVVTGEVSDKKPF